MSQSTNTLSPIVISLPPMWASTWRGLRTLAERRRQPDPRRMSQAELDMLVALIA